VALKKEYESNFIAMERVKSMDMGVPDDVAAKHSCYKITKVVDEEEDVSSMPQYFSAFAVHDVYPLQQHVVDALVEQTVGHVNIDMRRNITVDLYDTHSGRYAELSDALWRDRSGFMVADRARFAEIDISRSALLAVLAKPSAPRDDTLTFEPLNPRTAAAFLEYDTDVVTLDRVNYLEHLFGLNGVKGTVAFDVQRRPCGYVLSLGGRVLQCYGESPAIATSVLAKHASQMIEPNVSMFIRVDATWLSEELKASALAVRRVRRFHTRIVPTQVKWHKVFALNMGSHLL